MIKYTAEQRTAVARLWIAMVQRLGIGIKIINKLSAHENAVILALLTVACFFPKRIKFAKFCSKKNVGGSKEPINKWGPFIVFDSKGMNFDATGWLDGMLQFTISAIAQHVGNPGNLISDVVLMLENAVPLEPIVLPGGKGYLLEPKVTVDREKGMDYLARHSREDDEIPVTIIRDVTLQRSVPAGIHGHECGGIFRLKNGDELKNNMRCDKCGLGFDFPICVITYGEVREFFSVGLIIDPSSNPNMKRNGPRKKRKKVDAV